VIGGSAQRSIRLSAGIASLPDRAENDFAIVRAVARAVPLRTVNGRLREPKLQRDAQARSMMRACLQAPKFQSELHRAQASAVLDHARALPQGDGRAVVHRRSVGATREIM
jgi:hypothetical protein